MNETEKDIEALEYYPKTGSDGKVRTYVRTTRACHREIIAQYKKMSAEATERRRLEDLARPRETISFNFGPAPETKESPRTIEAPRAKQFYEPECMFEEL